MTDLEAAVEKARQKLEFSMDSEMESTLKRRKAWFESGLVPEGRIGTDEELAAGLLELVRRLEQIEQRYKAEERMKAGERDE